jgi:GTPase SAR1 family protein
LPEIKQYCPDAPIVLVGTKTDLREDLAAQRSLNAEGKAFVTRKDAVKVAKKIKAHKLLECSALTQQGLQNVSRIKTPNLHEFIDEPFGF